MKKFFLILITILLVSSASAQVHFGGNINVNFNKEKGTLKDGAQLYTQNEYQVNLKPKIYWNVNEKLHVGSRLGFAFGRIKTGEAYDPIYNISAPSIDRAVGWSFNPFCSFKLLKVFKILNIWLEGNAFIGQMYNIADKKDFSDAWSNQLQYGVQVLPVVGIDLNETLSLDLHLGVISLGWAGTYSKYEYGTVSTSALDVRKGGVDGLIQGFRDYGIGITKKF